MATLALRRCRARQHHPERPGVGPQTRQRSANVDGEQHLRWRSAGQERADAREEIRALSVAGHCGDDCGSLGARALRGCVEDDLSEVFDAGPARDRTVRAADAGPEDALSMGWPPALIDLQDRLLAIGNDGTAAPPGGALTGGEPLGASEEAMLPPSPGRSAS